MSSDFSQCSILKGILQNGSALNYPAVRFGRVPKREKAKVLVAIPPPRVNTPESKVMAEMSDDTRLIETIVRAHYDTCDYTRNKMEPILQKARLNPTWVSCLGSACPMKGSPENSILNHFSEIFMDHVRQVCAFAKLIPGFKGLHHDDQVTLLKSCVFEVLLVRLAGLFDNQSLVCLNGDIIRRETVQQMPSGNAKLMMESVFRVAQRINQMRLSDAEIGLLCAIVIITPDRAGLRNQELLDQMQTKLKSVLSSILLPQHLDQANIFPELMIVIHDLRTLNTLHTEKFLQQCKISGTSRAEEVQRPKSHSVSHPQPSWEIDRDSTGNGSPPSSDAQSSSSVEDNSSRRSPVESVSSTESIGPSDIHKLTTHDLRVNGSMLMNALIAPSSATCAALLMGAGSTTRQRLYTEDQCPSTSSSMSSSAITGSMSKTRKLDSPLDSGIDSPRVAQGSSHSTNTSVCSSPRSLADEVEKSNAEDDQRKRASPPSASYEDRHPLLKRALQQPALNGNGSTGGASGTVMNFKDEVYKPHKKFRRNTGGSSNSDEFPTSTQAGPGSPPPTRHSSRQGGSLLASQLAEPPKYLSSDQRYSTHRHYLQQRDERTVSGSSLLATTLSRVTTSISNEECRRNEILAKLILEGNPADSFSGLPRCALSDSPSSSPSSSSPSIQPPSTRSSSASMLRHQLMSNQPPKGLLMCVSSHATSESWWKKSAQTTPNPQLVNSATNSSPAGRPKSGEPQAETPRSTTGEFQPLNLSTRTPPPPQPTSSTPKSRQDIPTEA